MKDTVERKERIGPSTSFKVDNKLWKEIWSLEVYSKFTGNKCYANLFQKKVRSDSLCFICLKEFEIAEHLCFLCEWTILV